MKMCLRWSNRAPFRKLEPSNQFPLKSKQFRCQMGRSSRDWWKHLNLLSIKILNRNMAMHYAPTMEGMRCILQLTWSDRLGSGGLGYKFQKWGSVLGRCSVLPHLMQIKAPSIPSGQFDRFHRVIFEHLNWILLDLQLAMFFRTRFQVVSLPRIESFSIG